MSNDKLGAVVQHIRTLAAVEELRGLGDRHLLELFVTHKDEAAFAALFKRYGPLVFGVCRHLLRHEQDTQDAFQATFLVLARKAGSITKRQALASWLHGVAYRTAMKAKRESARRRAREAKAQERKRPPDPSLKEAWLELQAVLDEEVQRLPEKIQSAFVLCCMEGHSRADAALQLGIKEGTVRSRLNQARMRLQRRLARHGITLSGALGSASLLSKYGAEVPGLLLNSTVRAVLQAVGDRTSATAALSARVIGLAEHVTRSLVVPKLATALLFTVALFAGSAGVSRWMMADEAVHGDGHVAANAPSATPDRGQFDHAVLVRTDRLGDPLPPGAVARVGTIRLRHGDGISSVAFTPDGKAVVSASGSFDPTVRFWDPGTGKELRRLQVYPGFPNVIGGVLDMAFSPDGTQLATATYRMGPNPVILWDVRTGARLRSFLGHSEGIRSVAFSPDGNLLASASYDQTVRLWHAAKPDSLRTFNGHKGAVYCVRFSPDGKTLASAGADGTIRFWETSMAKESRQLKGHKGSVFSVTFDREGKALASGGRDGTVRLWDVAGERELHVLRGHRGDVASVAFSQDGALLASVSRDRTVHLWDGRTGKELRRLPVDRLDFSSVAFSPDGKWLAAGGLDNGICVWDLEHDKELLPFPGHRTWVLCLQYSPDGQTLVSGGTDGVVRLSDPQTGQERGQLAVNQAAVQWLALSPDGRTLLTWTEGPALALWDRASGKMLRRLVGPPGGLRHAAFSPDGRTIAAAGVNQKVQLWDSATGAALGSFPVGLAEVRSLAFAPDGKMMALGGDFKDRCIALHELPTGKELRRLLGHTYAVSSVAFVPDGKLLVSASPDRTMRLWDVASGKELRRIDVTPYQAMGGFNGMALSADGRFAASAGQDHQIRIWEVATFQKVRSFTGHGGDVYAVAFAPNGRTLASASRDGTILVWDASGRGPDSSKRLGPHELDGAWANLASMDAPTGERAMWALVAAPGQAVTLLAQRLRPIPRVEAARLARLVADLGSDRFSVREKATEDLERLGEAAAPALRKALEAEPPLEVRRRVERLLGRLEGGERLRQTRALAALERIGTPEAAQALEGLAGGTAGAWLTQEARTSLDRLRRRPAAAP